MIPQEFRAQAHAIIERRRQPGSIDRAALAAATHRPVIVAKFISNGLGGLFNMLSGADYNASQVGQFYQQALAKLLSSTGSPAAQQFAGQEKAALQPLFAGQDQALAAKEAAMGITNSGAAKADFSNLSADQSATLAGAIAPLYQSAIGSYGNILGAGAGAQTGVYQDSLNNFYQALTSAGSAAAGAPVSPSMIGGSGAAPMNPYTIGTTQPGAPIPLFDPNNPFNGVLAGAPA